MNISETKVMRCQVGIGHAEESGKYPWGVFKQGVGDNSIKFVACHRWVHKGVVVFQVDWGMLLISCYRRCLDGDFCSGSVVE